MRPFLRLGAYWLMGSLRAAMPRRSSGRVAQFDPLRLRLVKLAARVEVLRRKVRLPLPCATPDQAILAWAEQPKVPSAEPMEWHVWTPLCGRPARHKRNHRTSTTRDRVLPCVRPLLRLCQMPRACMGSVGQVHISGARSERLPFPWFS
jgi:hypothetical protein